MASDTEICNKALSHLGSSKHIANLEERSQEARACAQFYESTRDEVLSDFEWPFATKFAALALVEENPTSEWAYAYRYPSDCLAFRRILSGLRTDNRDTAVPHRIGQDDEGLLIYTDQEQAQCEYTVRVTNVERWTATFVNTLSLLLASYIAPMITGGDPFKKGDRAYQMYMMKKDAAKIQANREEKPDQDPETDSIRARY